MSVLRRIELTRNEAQSDNLDKVLDTLFRLVQEKSAASVLDVIVNAPSEQAKTLHLALLTLVVKLIAKRSTYENSSSQKLCGTVPAQLFVEEILLQILDVLYAYFAHDAWANCVDGNMTSGVLGAVRELTGAVGKVVPLIETASRILVSGQQTQKWYRSGLQLVEGDRIFVSTVNPRQYASFLKSGERAKIGESSYHLQHRKCVFVFAINHRNSRSLLLFFISLVIMHFPNS